MRILFIGDIIGKPGRDVIAAELPKLQQTLALDFIVVNGENLAGGFGVTRATANEMFAPAVFPSESPKFSEHETPAARAKASG